MTQGNTQNDRFAGYIPVAERVEKFYAKFPEGRIITAIEQLDHESGFVLMRASIYRTPDDAEPAATGHASEVRGDSYVNKTSYIENCETGAVGRALALLGFEVKRGNGTSGETPPPTRTQAAPRENKPQAAKTQAAPAQPDPKLAAEMRAALNVDYTDDPNIEEHVKLDNEIMDEWVRIGKKPHALHTGINKKYEVDDGLASLTVPIKKEFLKGLRAVEAAS